MSTAVRRALYGKLAGDTTLNALLGTPAPGYSKSIYYQQAPEGAGFPFVLISKQSGVPTQAFGDPDAFDEDVWLAKGVDRSSSSDTVESIQDRIRTLLNDASLSISGQTLTFLRRQSDVDYGEVDRGTEYRHAGSLYRVVTT